MSKKVSKWINVEKNKWMLLLPSGLVSEVSANVTYQHAEPESGRLRFDSQSWCWPRLLSVVGHGAPSWEPCCPPCPITWQGPSPVLGKQYSAWQWCHWWQTAPQSLQCWWPSAMAAVGELAGAGQGVLACGQHLVFAKHFHAHGICWILWW